MASLNHDNIFQSWVLTRQEYLTGSILTTLQLQCIQNQIAQLAQEKTLLKFTPNDLNTFLQREAELQGSISALQFLISTSAEAAKELDPGLSALVINSGAGRGDTGQPSIFPPLAPNTNQPPSDSEF